MRQAPNWLSVGLAEIDLLVNGHRFAVIRRSLELNTH